MISNDDFFRLISFAAIDSIYFEKANIWFLF